MSGQESPPQEIIQAIELADGYLHEAQDVLWNTASDFPADSESQQLEELAEKIWTVQHQINDLQRKFEQ
jgi:hypothetical protein